MLSAAIFLPAAGALVVALLPDRRAALVRSAALAISLATLALCAGIFLRVKGSGDLELNEAAAWMPSLGIRYRVAVDGSSMLLMLMTALLSVTAILASWREIGSRVKLFHALILLLECAMLGLFAAVDMFLFFVFWEAVLIPMYFIIGIWGSGDRARAALKFVIFTMSGSVLMLLAIVYAGGAAGSFDLVDWLKYRFSPTEQRWLFAAFALAFAVKVPVIGLHTWLPDAHTEAPTAGSVLLAGVLLKMGGYGFYRVAMPLFPVAVAQYAPLMLTLAVIGIIAGALLAMVQTDLKRLIAYSSISHMGFVMLGLWALNGQAAAGAVLMMVNHGLVTGALFLIVGMLYERRHTRLIADYGGSARSLPLIAAAFMFMSLASMGLPGLNNFASEFLVLLGAFQTRTAYAAISVAGVVLTAAYLLWAIQRVFLGPLKNEDERKMPDLGLRECASLIPLAALVFIIGIWPQITLAKISRPSDAFVALSKRVEMFVPVTQPPTPH